MERSRKILLEISSASQQVITAANKYADWKGLRRVPHSHVQLEKDMRRMSVACDTFADILGRSSSLPGYPEFDVRLQDWLCTEEPQICLDTLTGMIKLLQMDTFFSTIPILNTWRGQPTQDRIKEAVELLDSRKDYFYFLFSTETLNNGRGVQQQDALRWKNQIVTEGSNIRSKNSPTPAQSNINKSIPKTLENEQFERVMDKEKKENAEKLEEILKWLDGLNCAEKQDRTLSLRQPDTCEWLFNTAQYKTWRNGEGSCLWLRGKPGAGKSVLASSVIEHFEKIQQDGGFLAFFYCDFRNERSTNASEIFRSLLSQLLRQISDNANDLGSLIGDLVIAKDRGGATRNSTMELAAFISRTTGVLARKPWVVVDALDECRDVENLLRGLIGLKGHVRLFVTSRPLQVIMNGIRGFPCISMDDMVEELSADIALHVTRELATRSRLRRLDADIQADIHSVLCHGADGMFRWVECSIDTLNRCVTLEGVQRALHDLPKGLEETYKRILLAIDVATDEGKLALRALVWLVATLRPLKIRELMEGLSIHLEKRAMDFSMGPIDSETLLEVCGSLVTYSEKTGIVILSHFSVKEYLTGKLTCVELPEYHINWERAHLQLVRSCMCYISICLNGVREPNDFSVTESSALCRSVPSTCRDSSHLILWPLRDYVFDDAPDHLQYLGALFGLLLDDITVLADVINQHRAMWDNMCLSAARVMETTTPCWPTSKHDLLLYILVAFSPNSFLHVYLRRTVLKPKEGTNPLIYAAYFNKEAHARTLLSRGAELNCWGWDAVVDRWALPLDVALDNYHYSMVTLFVAEGSIVPTRIFPSLFCHDKDHQPHIPNYVRMILLQTEDFVEVVNDPNGKGYFLQNTGLQDLFRMARWENLGWESIVAITRRWLQVVGAQGHDSVPCLIRSAIQFLSQDAALESTRLLVNYGYEPFFSPSSLEALRIALEEGHVPIVKYLLSLQCDAPLPPDILPLALDSSKLSDTDKASLVSVLIENGADVHSHSLNARDSVLHIVLRSFSEDHALHLTKLLVSRGYDPLEINYPGDPLLYIATQRGHISVARFLLSLGIPLPLDILFVMFDSQLSLVIDPTPIVRLLIETGADIHARPYSVLCAPLRSLEGDDALQTTKLLVNYGCDPLQVDSEGNSPLHIAIKYRRTSVVQYLLSLGIPLPSDILSFTLNLRGVSAEDAVSMACLLIEHGADIHTRTSTGDSSLPTALRLLYEDDPLALKITKLFIDRGFDPLEVDSGGESTLHIAVRQFHISVVQHLLSIDVCLPPDILLVASHSEPRSQTIASESKVSMISLLIKSGGNVHACTPAGDSVLHIALQSRLSDDHALHITKLLLNRGFDPVKADSPRKSLLRIAVESFNTSVVQYLVSLGVYLPPDILLLALHSRDVGSEASMVCLRDLVERGADVHACTLDGDPALHILLESFNISDAWAFRITERFVSHGFDPLKLDSSGNSLLCIAIERVYAYAVRYLLSFRIPLPPDILFVALKSRPKARRRYHILANFHELLSVLHILIENGADIHTRTPDGDSLFHTASSLFNDEEASMITKLLLDHGCDPLQVNSCGESPLHLVVKRGHISVARCLLSFRVSLPTDILLSALRYVNTNVSLPMVSLLIEHGADVHTCNLVEDSALHMVTLSAHYLNRRILPIIKLLVHHGCNPLQVNSLGESPLHIAVNLGHLSVTRYLLSLRVPLPPDILFVAVNSQITDVRLRMIYLLVKSGAGVHECTLRGESVLHIALQTLDDTCAFWITKFLVGYGFNPLQVDSSGKTLLRIALDRDLSFVAHHLRSLGACDLDTEHGQTRARSGSLNYLDADSTLDHSLPSVASVLLHDACDSDAEQTSAHSDLPEYFHDHRDSFLNFDSE